MRQAKFEKLLVEKAEVAASITYYNLPASAIFYMLFGKVPHFELRLSVNRDKVFYMTLSQCMTQFRQIMTSS